jgi:AraC family transcriptional regulator
MSNTSLAPDFLAEVLAYIEAHRFEPMTVTELATVAGFSPYHFSRLFTARFGESVMGYVRTCRLQAAAVRLSGDEPPALVDLALECGFGSQEAFTRAFRNRYGVPPGQFKRQELQRQPAERNMSDSKAQATVERLEELVKRNAFSVAGVRAVFDKQNKSGIPGLWPRLVRCLPLPGQVNAVTYGVIWMENNKDEGRFDYLAGVEAIGDAELPEGFERVQLAAQTYVVFRLTLDGSPLHPQMQAAMPLIWCELLPQSGLKPAQAPDLEVYPADFEPMRKGSYLDVYIAIEAA